MVRKFRKRVSGLINLNKFIYLISPKEINKNFYNKLDKVLVVWKCKVFSIKIEKQTKIKSFQDR